MKPFDPEAKCPKCGCMTVITVYENGSHYVCPLPFPERYRAHLERICQRCHYRWAKACLDDEEREHAGE